MDVLVLGGTRFVGRHFVKEALQSGHRLTLFHRGSSPISDGTDVEEIFGDRDGSLDLLANRTWDAVVDTCGYLPRVVHRSAEAMKGRVGRYLFVSTVSVYTNFQVVGIDESSPVYEQTNFDSEEITNESYGPLKAHCERVLRDTFFETAVIVRPGLIVGPYDPTDRFTYWPAKFSRKRVVAAPEPRSSPVQFLDARDLSEFMLLLLQSDHSGIFNVVGPDQRASMESFLRACQKVIENPAEICWVDEPWREQLAIEEWTDFPLWVHPNGESRGVSCINADRARNAGLKTRPIEQTIKDTLAWFRAERNEEPMKAGLDDVREERLLSLAGKLY